MNARHRDEIEFTLIAVVNAIQSGILPPDDAKAWARIAACEAKALAQPEAVWHPEGEASGSGIAIFG
jgi:hypothetical protein